MDMSTPTSPYVVHAFYHLLLIESVIFTALILAGVLIWNILFRKRDDHLRLHASIAVKSHDEPFKSNLQGDRVNSRKNLTQEQWLTHLKILPTPSL
ncbi:hypothetical protein, partial [Ferroacidibacillus organovorans]|uniref:hypothetical protein n=1 Tax=Ferroacidibacillus organovorans TaxID=1765683 RepID=UPI001F2CA354